MTRQSQAAADMTRSGFGACLGFERKPYEGEQLQNRMGKTYMDSRRNVIAVVDNDQQLRGALGLLLSASGYRTELFASAEEFLSAAPTSEAACLVVETQLSGLSGIELGRQLASAGFKFPIIFLTRSWDAAIRQEAMNWGCIAYLHKSFLAEPLIEAIEMATAPNLSEPDK